MEEEEVDQSSLIVWNGLRSAVSLPGGFIYWAPITILAGSKVVDRVSAEYKMYDFVAHLPFDRFGTNARTVFLQQHSPKSLYSQSAEVNDWVAQFVKN